MKFNVPLKVYIEYFYNKTNVDELRDVIQPLPGITINTLYDAISYGLINPLSNSVGLHYLVTGAEATVYHLNINEYEEQSICITKDFANHVILSYHCNPISRKKEDAYLLPIILPDTCNPLTTLKLYPYKPIPNQSSPISLDITIFHMERDRASDIVTSLLLDACKYLQQKEYRYFLISAHTAYKLATKRYFEGLVRSPQFHESCSFLANSRREKISTLSTKYFPLITALTGKPMPPQQVVTGISRLTRIRNELSHQTQQPFIYKKKEMDECLIAAFFICKYFELEIPTKDYSEYLG